MFTSEDITGAVELILRLIIAPIPTAEPTIIGVAGETRIRIQEKEDQEIIKHDPHIEN